MAVADKQMTRATQVIGFIEGCCLTPEGEHVGKPLVLMPFQKKFIRDIYDNPSGTNRAYLSVARKNGKSSLIAAILLAHLAGPEARLNSQIISGARSREQAALVFELAEKMVRLSPLLSEIIKIIPSQKSLVGLSRNVKYRAISAEAGTAHGLSPVLAILDEVGQVRGPSDAFVEAIETAQGAHADPLLIAISTQAATDGDMFSVWLDDAAKAPDARTVSHFYTAPQDCKVTDRKAWKAANPALGVFRSQQDIEGLASRAARLPSQENVFRHMFLNQRIEANSPFLSKSEWEANNGPATVDDGDLCFAGLDLSSSQDLTAFVLVFPKGDHYHVVPQFFLPADGLADKSRMQRIPYDMWASQGFLTTIPGPVIIPAVVAMAVAEANARYDLRMLAYDRWRINDFQRELDGLGASVPMRAFGQGFKDMAPALDKVEQLVMQKSLRHGNHPVMNMCAANAVVQQDPAGNRTLDKAKSYSKIDGMVALTMALGCMGDDVVQYSSPWDDPAYQMAI